MVGLTRLLRNLGIRARSLPTAAFLALALVMVGLGGCTTQLFETISDMVEFSNRSDKVAPMVTFTTPSHGSSTAPVNTKISVTFSEPMDPGTIHASTFTVNDGAFNIDGTIQFVESSKAAVFTPASALNPILSYTCKVKTDVKDLEGNGLESEYSWIFQPGGGTDNIAPTVSSVFPANGTPNASINTAVSATFSEPLDPSSIDSSKFRLEEAGVGPVGGTVTYIDSSRTVLFDPAADLTPSKLHTVVVNAGIKDMAGNPLASDYGWSFTTAALSDTTPPTVVTFDPGNRDVDVSVTENITVVFSEFMNSNTINNTTFSMRVGMLPVTGTVSYNPATNTATFDPQSNLSYFTLYTVTLTTGIKDAAGNPLTSGASWTFMTRSSDSSVTSITAAIGKLDQTATDQLTALLNVADQSGVVVPGLTNYHIRVQESINSGPYIDVPITKVSIGTTRKGKSVAFLVDNSASMSSFFNQYKSYLMGAIASLKDIDKACIVTFMSPVTGAGGYNYVDVYPPTGPTSDKDALLGYLSALPVDPLYANAYTLFYDGNGKGMESLNAQPADVLRGLNGVVSFTDATAPYPGLWDESACVSYSSTNNIPIWSIAHYPAYQAIPTYLHNLATSGYYYETVPTGVVQTTYMQILEIMESMLPYLYSVAWTTQAGPGADVDVRITATYANERGVHTSTGTASITMQ